jgi:tight adherence protein C
VNLLPVLASLFAGAAVGLMAAAVVGMMAGGQETWRPPDRGMAEALRPVLNLIALPRGIEAHWASEAVEQRMRFAGLNWDAREYAAARWALLWLGILLAVMVGVLRRWDLLGQFLVILMAGSAYFGPDVWLQWRSERRRMEIDIALPDFLDRLALGLDAGLGFEVALRRTAHDFRGLLGEKLRRLVRQLDRGHPRTEALREMADQTPSDDLHAFVAAVQQSDRLGTSLARSLRVQTTLLRARRRRRAQEASRRLPILIVFPLVFFFLPALLIIYLAPPLLHLFLGR